MEYKYKVVIYSSNKKTHMVPYVKLSDGTPALYNPIITSNAPYEYEFCNIVMVVNWIKKTPVIDRPYNMWEWEYVDDCSGELSFWKSHHCVHVYLSEEGDYEIFSLQKDKKHKGKFYGCVKKLFLPNNISQKELRDAIDEVFQAAIDYYNGVLETPVGMVEHRSDTSIGKCRFPWRIAAYKGENRIMIIPSLECVGGFLAYSDKITIITDMENAIEIGNAVLEAVDVIRTSPRLLKVEKSWEKGSKYKSYIGFWNNNLFTDIEFHENGEFIIESKKKSMPKGTYEGNFKKISLPMSTKAEEIGNSVIDCFMETEKLYNNKK